MRFQELFESSKPTKISRSLFKRTLRVVLTKMMAYEWVTSIEMINNGACADFAMAVMNALGLRFYDRTPELRVYQTGNFFDEDDHVLDLEKLRAMGEPVPSGLSDEKIAYDLSVKHFWLYFKGKHYDAETLDGVSHFLQLPFFQRIIDNMHKPLQESLVHIFRPSRRRRSSPLRDESIS